MGGLFGGGGGGGTHYTPAPGEPVMRGPNPVNQRKMEAERRRAIQRKAGRVGGTIIDGLGYDEPELGGGGDGFQFSKRTLGAG